MRTSADRGLPRLSAYRRMAALGATSPFTMASAKVGSPPIPAVASWPVRFLVGCASGNFRRAAAGRVASGRVASGCGRERWPRRGNRAPP
jgi:hypothetical protein